jgi:hypothetical protein
VRPFVGRAAAPSPDSTGSIAIRILLTGAAGSVASFLYPRLVRPDRVLRLLDLRPPVLGDAELRAVSVAAAELGVPF